LNEAQYADAIGATLFLTPGPIGVGVRHGYQPLGRPLVVIRIEGNILYELDGKTAFEAYAEQLQDPTLTSENFAKVAENHPVGLPQMGREYIIRDPYASGPNGSLHLAGQLPKHAVVRIMKGDRESLLNSARQAAEDAMAGLGGKPPLFALVFDCITRVNYLGEAASVEIETIQQVLGPETPVIGLVSFGEIAAQPYSPPAFHNKAVVVGVVGAV
jgi:hypothetical protein